MTHGFSLCEISDYSSVSQFDCECPVSSLQNTYYTHKTHKL